MPTPDEAELVEAVAQAMYVDERYTVPWAKAAAGPKQGYRYAARAAFSVIRPFLVPQIQQGEPIMPTPNLQQAIQALQQARNLQGTLDHLELSIDQMPDGMGKSELQKHITEMGEIVSRMASAAEQMKREAKQPAPPPTAPSE